MYIIGGWWDSNPRHKTHGLPTTCDCLLPIGNLPFSYDRMALSIWDSQKIKTKRTRLVSQLSCCPDPEEMVQAASLYRVCELTEVSNTEGMPTW